LQSDEWQREWLQVYLDRNWLYYTQNQQERMQQERAVMESHINSIGTPEQRYHFYRISILAAFRRERYRLSDETMKLVTQAQQAAMELGLASTTAEVHFVAGFANLWRDDLASAEPLLQHALSESSRLEDAVLKSRCLTYLTVLYRKLTNEELTGSFAARALEHTRAINMQEYVAAALANQAWLALRANQWDEVKKLANEALSIWQSLPVSSPFEGLAIWPLLVALMRDQKIEEACKAVEILLHPAQQPQLPEIESLLQSMMADCRTHDFEKASRKLREALDLMETRNYC
jgi:hypothetical protein